MSNRSNPKNIAMRRLKKQEHAEAKEARKAAPDNKPMKLESTRSAAVCRACNIKPRAQGSSRCTSCSLAFSKSMSKS